MQLGELLLLRKKRKNWALKKQIIMESVGGIRCPYRTDRPCAEAVMQLEVVREKISRLQLELIEDVKY